VADAEYGAQMLGGEGLRTAAGTPRIPAPTGAASGSRFLNLTRGVADGSATAVNVRSEEGLMPQASSGAVRSLPWQVLAIAGLTIYGGIVVIGSILGIIWDIEAVAVPVFGTGIILCTFTAIGLDDRFRGVSGRRRSGIA
jgi:hypothetical protein